MSDSPAAPVGRTERLSRLRRTIANRMVESLHVSAQLTTVVEVDFTHVSAYREEVKQQFLHDHGIKLSFLPFIARAAVDALTRHPVVNASIDLEKGEATYYETRNLSIAVDTPRGLVAPVIFGAGDLSLSELAASIAALAERSRAGKLMPDDLSGSTFTLTNTGSRGALFDTPIINQPNVAILGAGAIVERPVVVRDETGGRSVEPRPMAYFALSYDHRLVDGADAARYLADVKQLLETPQWTSDGSEHESGGGRHVRAEGT